MGVEPTPDPRSAIGYQTWVGLHWKDPDRPNSGSVGESVSVEWSWDKDKPYVKWRKHYRRGGTVRYYDLSNVEKIAASVKAVFNGKVHYWQLQKRLQAERLNQYNCRKERLRRVFGDSDTCHFPAGSAKVGLDEGDRITITLRLSDDSAFEFLGELVKQFGASENNS